ncbi:MAG: DNA mismatch repair ATPase msh1 [Sclerophora amabilis]|nr:MAG: DNA mismatch repair ATPase msh1 [Sclerophora amabilis]
MSLWRLLRLAASFPPARNGIRLHHQVSSRIFVDVRSQNNFTRWPSPPVSLSKVGQRGAKRTSKIRTAELPQGLIALQPPPDEPVEAIDTSYPTVVQQAKNNMRRFEKCILLTRLYFEQAEKYGPLLGLKVAHKKTNAGPVPMAGFPIFQRDRFLKILVQDLSSHVAISEEFPNNASDRVKSGGLLFDRRVSRIITPGTLIDEQFMDPFVNNFLLAVYATDTSSRADAQTGGTFSEGDPQKDGPESRPPTVGLAWLDLSTGDFFTQSTSPSSLSSVAARIGPREIILTGNSDDFRDQAIDSFLEEYKHLCAFHQPDLRGSSLSDWEPTLENNDVPLADSTQFTTEEIKAGTSLLEYVKVQLQGLKMRFQPPVQRQETDIMSIDKHSLRALEIKTTLRDGVFKGSLLHAIRKTVTSSGSRLLNNWLISPSTSLATIEHRLNLVSYFGGNQIVMEDIVQQLRRSYDSQRLVQKFSLGRGDADDLLALSKTIQATQTIVTILTRKQEEQPLPDDVAIPEESHASRVEHENACLDSILSRLALDGPEALALRIAEAIDEDGISQKQSLEEDEERGMVAMARAVASAEGSEADMAMLPKKSCAKSSASTKANKSRESEYEDPCVIRRSASSTMDNLHNSLDELKAEKVQLEGELRQKLGASSLTLRWTPGLGHICHLKGKDTNTSISSVTKIKNVGSSRSTRSFHISEWTDLGLRMDRVKLQMKMEEQRVLADLREQAVRNLVKLRRNAAVLDELDIACSFAISAREQGLVRPLLNHGTSHRIIGARHPMVEIGLQEQARSFVSNDCFVGDQERVWLLTGPNMGGKSTFLRQNALISILAQIGSFVPAEYAELGIVDSIFSRIGAADNLYEGQSTFMVEMLETAAILQKATPRSFVIMDEVGRGTTPEDGIAIGYACLHHLHYINKCRALFATHFHALSDMTSHMEHLACYCTDIAEESNGSFSFVHRLRKGVNRDSHALKIARLAGLPQAAIELASNVLAQSRDRHSSAQTPR